MKNKILFCLCMITIIFLGFSTNSKAYTPNANDMVFSKGHKKKSPHVFQSAESCQNTPCVIGKFGAIQFSKKIREHYNIELGYFNQDGYHSLALFQEGADLNEKLFERLLNKRKNRNIFNLEQALQMGETDIVYLYGILLHYHLEEGDIVIVRLRNAKNNKQEQEYYFCYHRKGPIFRADLAVISPINYFKPNPNNAVRSASISAALSFSVGANIHPEKKYNFFTKFLYAWRFNVFGGLLKRGELQNTGVDQFVDQKFDGFFGAGFTFVDFFVGGVGINLVRSPHSFFPFVGLEVTHLYDFIKSMKKSTKKKWNKYQKEQDLLKHTSY